MNRIIFFALIFLCGFISNSAHAWGYEKLKNENGDVVSKISGVKANGDHPVPASEIEGGIYVVATTVMKDEMLPASTAVIREYLAKQGFKIVEKASDAKIGIRFRITGPIVDEPPMTGSDSNAPNLGEVAIANAMANAAGFITNGLPFMYGNSGRVAESVDIRLTGQISYNPTQGMLTNGVMDKVDYRNAIDAVYYTKKKFQTADVLRNLVDQWVKNHIAK